MMHAPIDGLFRGLFPRSFPLSFRRSNVAALGLIALGLTTACAPHPDARTAREEATPAGLSYRVEVDSTRLRRGSGLSAVESVAQLVEDGLSRFFRPQKNVGKQSDTYREILAEAPAPGYAIRAVIEQRADDFCLVSIDAVLLRPEGAPVPTPVAPYSVHFGLATVRAAIGALRSVAWPVMSNERFDLLRKQAAALAAAGSDPPIDESTFAHAPRPLERADDPPRYYAPPTQDSSIRGQ